MAVDAIANLTATALVGVLLFWTITKGIPGIISEFRKEMQEERHENRQVVEILRAEQAEERSNFRSVMQDVDRWVKQLTEDKST